MLQSGQDEAVAQLCQETVSLWDQNIRGLKGHGKEKSVREVATDLIVLRHSLLLAWDAIVPPLLENHARGNLGIRRGDIPNKEFATFPWWHENPVWAFFVWVDQWGPKRYGMLAEIKALRMGSLSMEWWSGYDTPVTAQTMVGTQTTHLYSANDGRDGVHTHKCL